MYKTMKSLDKNDPARVQLREGEIGGKLNKWRRVNYEGVGDRKKIEKLVKEIVQQRRSCRTLTVKM